MNSAVITGGTSFLGLALIKELLNHNVQCYTIVRPTSKNIALLPKDSNLHIILEDVKNTEKWQSFIPKCDVFFHLAWDGVGSKGRADKIIQESNVKMSIDCLNTALQLRCCRFVFAGSQAEYGNKNTAINEKTVCDPVTEYGKGKLDFANKARAICQNNDMVFMHLRIFSVYGPGDHPWTLVASCIKAFQSGETIKLSFSKKLWNYLFITDAAKAIFQCGVYDTDKSMIINIAGEETKPLTDFVNTIHKLCSFRGNIEYGVNDDHDYGIDPQINVLKNMGWKQTISFEQGINRMLF